MASESAFDDRMDALSREIGSRGRADAAKPGPPGPESGPDASPDIAALRSELEPMRLMALHKRAVAEGVDESAVEDAVEAAMESGDPKATLIDLILEASSSRG